MIRCVVFDFDGTLVLSNEIKRDGFFHVARRISGGAAVMETVLREVDGDRVAVMTRFAREIGEEDSSRLVSEYTRWCEERISTCPERTGAARVLRDLRTGGRQIHVSSATPAESLRAIVSRRYPAHTFDGVHGGHSRKTAVLRELIGTSMFLPGALLCVGDGSDDWEAAELVGCHFAGVAGGTLARRASAPLIDDLADLLPLVARLEAGRAAFA